MNNSALVAKPEAHTEDRDPSVFFVGHRARHHANHSGYEGFARYVGVHLKPPAADRWRTDEPGWRLDSTVASLVQRREYSLSVLQAETEAAQHMLKHPGAIYHAIYGDVDLWLLPRAARAIGRRLVATFHEPVSILEWLQIREIVADVDAAVLMSSTQLPYFESILPPERIHFVPHGVDTIFFHPGRRRSTRATVICVGSKLRDFDLLHRAMKLVWSERGDVLLHLVGAPAANKAVNALSLDPRVHRFENLTDRQLRQRYRGSWAAILPLTDATANNALLEALACGVPVVSTAVGGIPEYLGGDAGLLCSPGDPEALAAGVLRLLSDQDLRRSMANIGRARAQEFDYRQMATEMRSIYRILDGREIGESPSFGKKLAERAS